MKLTKKELQDLQNTGTCEVIRPQNVSKKEIDFCFDNFSNGKTFTINGLNVIIEKLFANPFIYENKGYKAILKAK